MIPVPHIFQKTIRGDLICGTMILIVCLSFSCGLSEHNIFVESGMAGMIISIFQVGTLRFRKISLVDLSQ